MAEESLRERIARKKAEALAQQAGLVPPKEESTTVTVDDPPLPSNAIDSMVASLTKAVELQATVEKSEPTLDDLLDMPLGVTNKAIADEAAIVTADIIPRIRQLNSLSDAQLEVEMKLLKAALMANPEAVALMLPEDIGEMVVALRKITHEAVVAAEAKASSKSKGIKSKTTKTGQMEIADDF